ncbi:MAG: MBL fold metallo-hydrolase [Pseudomonadota bacterium]
MKRLLTAGAFGMIMALSAPTSAFALDLGDDYAVRTFASPDPDSVNSHLITTPNGVIVISAQRVESQALRAIERVKRIGKPVIAIVIPVPHTDHFGGLPTWRDAYPDAQVFAAEETITSMRTDGQGYVASRKNALGDDFPSQEEVNANLPTTVVGNDEEVSIDGITLRFVNLLENNAPVNTVVVLPEHQVMFSSELMEDGISVFLKDATIENWLSQLAALSTEYADIKIVFPAHGSSGPIDALVSETEQHLIMYQDGVDAALADDGQVDDAEVAALTAQIEAAYPDFAQVARVPRDALVSANIKWQAARRAD